MVTLDNEGRRDRGNEPRATRTQRQTWAQSSQQPRQGLQRRVPSATMAAATTRPATRANTWGQARKGGARPEPPTSDSGAQLGPSMDEITTPKRRDMPGAIAQKAPEPYIPQGLTG